MPQNQITDAPEIETELPELTAQQSEFVRARLAGKSASDAYRIAYNAADMLQSTVWSEASRVNTHPAVAAWLAAARKANIGIGTVTLAGHLQELERLREIALESGNIGAAVAAEQNRGKAAGLYVEQVRDVTDHDPAATLASIAATSPELAEALAKEAGIAWAPTPAGEREGTRH